MHLPGGATARRLATASMAKARPRDSSIDGVESVPDDGFAGPSASPSRPTPASASAGISAGGTQLLPLARERAALPDWSYGGWPDQFGAEVLPSGL